MSNSQRTKRIFTTRHDRIAFLINWLRQHPSGDIDIVILGDQKQFKEAEFWINAWGNALAPETLEFIDNKLFAGELRFRRKPLTRNHRLLGETVRGANPISMPAIPEAPEGAYIFDCQDPYDASEWLATRPSGPIHIRFESTPDGDLVQGIGQLFVEALIEEVIEDTGDDFRPWYLSKYEHGEITYGL